MLVGVGVLHHVVRARDEGDQVRRHDLGGREAVHHATAGGRGLLGRGVGHHHPLLGRGHRQGVAGLEVGLVEAGEHALGVRRLELRVEIDLPVGRVDHPVQALTGGGVRQIGVHDQLIRRLQVGQGDAVLVVVSLVVVPLVAGGRE